MTSLHGSIIDYRVENIRSYPCYVEGSGWTDRLDLQDHLFFLMFDNRPGFAPSNDPGREGARVPGVLCIDFGDDYPGVDVLGSESDLSATQPEFPMPTSK
ncbi:uncharacterized protein LY79DRAFT_665154 [Colletotrichum navitas]|uniref:Uncharacterized protein n=1 Tax=Colletotrichum navitas TaxID=681940 RepID=A0AAD8QC08_9PEZI|nr:uncharacterized protein LY79DRAFT_665154 [Colletotrichum navitas]KAK1599484.1 hypothetical protein LY79DRAFT_665154 [Colletotrichum navitas]